MVDLKEKFNELAKEYDKVMEQLQYYEVRVCPKYRVGDKLYCYNGKEKKQTEIKVDEIRVTKNGICYIEYIDEKGFMLFPEDSCFSNIIDLGNYIKTLENNK